MPGNLKVDLALQRRAIGVPAADRLAVDLQYDRGDLKLASGSANLAQAIINRLLTRQGELTGLGHPEYGSRLYQLIGEPNSPRTQVLAEMYVRESLALDKRILEVVSIGFAPLADRLTDRRYILDMSIVLRIAADEAPLTVTLALNLAG